jgi:homoserine dehydrogenase
MIQKGEDAKTGEVILAIVTHEGPESAVTEALRILDGSDSLAAQPLVMQIIEG